MKIKRILAIFLCLSLLLIPITGCGNSDDDEYNYDNGENESPEDTPPPVSSDNDEDTDPLEEAEKILRLLNEQIGSDDFVGFFHEMVFEHSEDLGGLINFPDGYLFREGDMVSEFFEAAKALEIGEISGIVETMYGYHIILRLPIDYDSTPIEFSGYENPPSLRLLAAMEAFRHERFQWRNALEFEYSQEPEALDIATIFEEGPDFDTSFPRFAHDTVMITAGDLTLSWSHLYAFMFPVVSEVYQLHEANGMEVDWHEDAFDGSTWAELVLEYALDEAESILALMYGMKVNNVTLSDDELQDLDERIEEQIERHGSKEAFEEHFREHYGFYNSEVLMDLTTIELGYGELFDYLYGTDGSEFPDDLARMYAEINGYLMAMHILRMKPGF